VTIPDEYRGWWRIIETSQWADDALDLLGPAMFSITGQGDRWRMLALLAHVDWHVSRGGLRFTLNGAWEFDPTSASGSVKLGRDGRISGTFKIKQGDSSTFIAGRTSPPTSPIPDPPSYRDKWARRW
jgi:hypothetical protein